MIATGSARDVLEDLYARYVDALDEDQLEAWPELFTPTCLYRVTSVENVRLGLPLAAIRAESRGMLRDRVAALRGTSMYIPRTARHLVTNVRILAFDGPTIEATARFAIFQTLPDEPTTVFATGVYRDVVREHEGEWLFAEKLCIYDGLISNSLVLPF